QKQRPHLTFFSDRLGLAVSLLQFDPADYRAEIEDEELPARANGSTHPSGSEPVAASGDPAPGARA
ncbi:hypothetical protein ACIKTA_08290, partial [Hansschlegelia beijingensis]